MAYRMAAILMTLSDLQGNSEMDMDHFFFTKPNPSDYKPNPSYYHMDPPTHPLRDK